MYLDDSFLGSDKEELIEYFLSFQADKVHLTQFVALVEHILNKDRKALIHQWDFP